LLAEQGLAGPARPIEGPRGFIPVMGGDDPDLSRLTDGLGKTWEITRNAYKPYPCGVVLNPVLDGVLDLRRQHDLEAGGIKEIVVTGHPLLRERTDRPSPASGREAQVSAQHSAAVALLRGAAGVEQYSDAAVGDPAVLALRAKVRVQDDPAIPVGAATVRILLESGREFTTNVEHARGSLERPLTDAELERKLAALAAYGSPGLDVAPLRAAIWSIEDVADMRALMLHAVAA
jgi:2-methylcitrate dehydratase PrpD